MLNNMKVFVLMAGLTALFVVVGGALAGHQGMFLAFLLAAGLNFFAYFNSGSAALRAFQVTSAVVGSIVHSIPPSCVPVVVNGMTYQQCGSTWYQPQYVGSSVQYVVVAPMR